jgi:hypothetical protein
MNLVRKVMKINNIMRCDNGFTHFSVVDACGEHPVWRDDMDEICSDFFEKMELYEELGMKNIKSRIKFELEAMLFKKVERKKRVRKANYMQLAYNTMNKDIRKKMIDKFIPNAAKIIKDHMENNPNAMFTTNGYYAALLVRVENEEPEIYNLQDKHLPFIPAFNEDSEKISGTMQSYMKLIGLLYKAKREEHIIY